MRARAFILVALFTLPSAADAQGIRIPRGRIPTPVSDPAPLPPQIEPVARALAYKQARWSVEGYAFVSAFEVPAAGGGATAYRSFGSGTHADYRFTDRWSATVDLTLSGLGSPVASQTAEAGTRFSPMSFDRKFRPFFDVRGGFMHMYDPFAIPLGSIRAGGSNTQLAEGSRYSRGFGGIAGAGLEISLTNSLSLTPEILALRNRMIAYRVNNPANIPSADAFSMNSLRFVLGLRYNRARPLHLAQSPR